MEEGKLGEPLCWDDGPDCVQAVDSWIASIHPDHCRAALEAVAAEHRIRERSATAGLIAHCVELHALSLPDLAKFLEGMYPPDVFDARIVAAIASQYENRLDALVRKWPVLASAQTGSQVVNYVARAAQDKGFRRFVERLIDDGLADSAPKLFTGVLPVVVNGHQTEVEPSQFFRERLAWLFKHWPSDIVRYLVSRPRLESARDELIERLFTADPVKAARHVVASEWYDDAPSVALRRAAEILWENNQDAELTVKAITAVLLFDPDFAIPKIVTLAHSLREADVAHGSASHLLRKFKDPERLFNALAEDSVRADRHAHDLFAKLDLDIVEDVHAAIAWLTKNPPARETEGYHASLIVELASKPNFDPGAAEGNALIAAVERLHGACGYRSEAEALRTRKVDTQKSSLDYPRLRALALARDVIAGPTREIPVEDILACLKKSHPHTYRAFGAEQLDQHLAKGRPVCNSWWYEADVEERYREAKRVWDESEKAGKPHFGAGMAANHYARALNQRMFWEERFRIIAEHDPTYDIKTKQVRESYNYWSELMLHAAFAPHFKIEREPTDVKGLEDKRPDFRLSCDDGALIFEATRVEAGPSSMLAGVQVSAGMELQKQVVDKWRKQFKACAQDSGLPIVIGVHVASNYDVAYDLASSLYGQISFSWTSDQSTGQMLAEGATRVSEGAFYHRANIDCISGVLGFVASDTDVKLVGEFYTPLREPKHPVSPRLWARLRTALFGVRPEATLRRWDHLPGITENERNVLVDAGLDDPMELAAGLYDDLHQGIIDDARWNELKQVARTRARLGRWERIADLPGLPPADIASFEAAGIHTIRRLFDTDEVLDVDHDGVERARAAARSWGFGRE